MDWHRERRRDGASVGRKPGVLWVSHSPEMHDGEQTDAPNVWRQWRAKRVHCTPGLGTAEWRRGGLKMTELLNHAGKAWAASQVH